MTRDNQNHRYAISLHTVKMVFPLVIGVCSLVQGQQESSFSRSLFGQSSVGAGATRQSQSFTGFSNVATETAIIGSSGGIDTSGFVGRGQSSDQAFVGRAASQAGSSTNGGNTNRGNTNRGNANRGGGARGQRGNAGLAGGRRSRPLGLVYRLAMENITPVSTVTVIPFLSSRLSVSSAFRGSQVSVQNEQSTVVIRGRVRNEYQRRLAERVARLEPAVRQVRNELVIGESGP
ncbi:MAG: BON domain-containing protein [Planctomycetota bacterium]|nr:BON domain-containing protein [Planctomycetota bacterium]